MYVNNFYALQKAFQARPNGVTSFALQQGALIYSSMPSFDGPMRFVVYEGSNKILVVLRNKINVSE